MEEQKKSDILQSFSKELPNLSLPFKLWFGDAFGNDQIETIIRAVIKSGNAADEREGLIYLDTLVKNIAGPQRIATVDFPWRTSKPRGIFGRLKKLMDETRKDEILNSNWRLYGILGHQAIPHLLSNGHGSIASEKQLTLLETNGDMAVNRIATKERHNNFHKKVELLWKSIVPYIEEESTFAQLPLFADPNLIAMTHKKLPEIEKVGEEIFREHFLRLKKLRAPQTPYLEFLTLMSWIAAFLFYYRANDRRVLFKEVRIFDKTQEFSGGRVDAIEVRRINGRLPNSNHIRILETMSGQKFSSVGNLLLALWEKLETTDLALTILDWKFAVGDGVHSIIPVKDIREQPLPKDLLQMKRYIVLSSLDAYLCAKEKNFQLDWPECANFLNGEIVYFMPTHKPICHNVQITSQEQKVFLRDEVATRFNIANRRAINRASNNLIIGNLIRQLEAKGTVRHQKTRNKEGKSLQSTLFPENEFKKPLKSKSVSSAKGVIDENRVFVDQNTKIIEIVSHHKYELHYDRLLDGISGMKIKTGYFQRGKGGFIICPNPEHIENTPSFHIDTKHMIFKCFGCQIGGIIDPCSIPLNTTTPFFSSAFVRRSFSHTINDILIPSGEYLKIMSQAQEALQHAFKGSAGERYLVKERAIDSDLALKYGVGFGTDALIENLLDSGFTPENLVFIGLIGISKNANSSDAIFEILKKRGFKNEKLRLEISNAKSGLTETLEGFPHSLLKNRVTFPLVLKGKINNLYGRTVVKHPIKHRKLSTSFSGIPHGAFNIDVLDGSGEEVIVVEGAIDALTLIQMGYPSTLALIGIDNMVVAEEIVLSGKKVAIALDNDTAGIKNTEKWMRRLNQKGNIHVRDFTAWYISQYPEAKDNADDWNTWWQKSQDLT